MGIFFNRRVALAVEKARAVIVVVPALDHRDQRLHGRFDAMFGARLLAHATRQPLLDGARELLRLGHPATDAVVMQHQGSGVDALRSTIGAAARLSVKERDRGGLLFERWDANCRSLERVPVAKASNPAVLGSATPNQAVAGESQGGN